MATCQQLALPDYFLPNFKLFYTSYKTALILFHKMGCGPSPKKAYVWCNQLGQAQAHQSARCWEDGDPLLHVYPSTCEFQSAPSDATWCLLHAAKFILTRHLGFLYFDINGQYKVSQTTMTIDDYRVPKMFFFPCHSWLNLIELIEFRWGVVQGSHDAHVSTQIIVLQNLNFYMVNQW